MRLGGEERVEDARQVLRRDPAASIPDLDDRAALIRPRLDLDPVALDNPSLDLGWWDIEWDAAAPRRWTKGDAVIPVPPGEITVLAVTLGGTLDYRLPPMDNMPWRRDQEGRAEHQH